MNVDEDIERKHEQAWTQEMPVIGDESIDRSRNALKAQITEQDADADKKNEAAPMCGQQS